MVLSLFVDHILLAGTDTEAVAATKWWLSSTFEMKDMKGQIIPRGVNPKRSKKFPGLSQKTLH